MERISSHDYQARSTGTKYPISKRNDDINKQWNKYVCQHPSSAWW